MPSALPNDTLVRWVARIDSVPIEELDRLDRRLVSHWTPSLPMALWLCEHLALDELGVTLDAAGEGDGRDELRVTGPRGDATLIRLFGTVCGDRGYLTSMATAVFALLERVCLDGDTSSSGFSFAQRPSLSDELFPYESSP